jgi:hypothetical protein
VRQEVTEFLEGRFNRHGSKRFSQNFRRLLSGNIHLEDSTLWDYTHLSVNQASHPEDGVSMFYRIVEIFNHCVM